MRRAGPLFVCALLAACSFAPDYKPPETVVPANYKEAGNWAEACTMGVPDRTAWWQVFHDPQLDALEEQVGKANQSLKVAIAQYDEARAIAAQARGAYFPSITGNASATRTKESGNKANPPTVARFNDLTFGADMSYELDLWGRVRNTVAANESEAEASAADLAGVALDLHADFADDYFALRGDDAAQVVLDKTVQEDQKALDLTRRLYEGGAAPEMDVDQAETQLENAKTQAADMQLQRAQLEHAMAVLIGVPPANFTMPAIRAVMHAPGLNPGVPSTLLERRPDIAGAERRVAAANAEIGVARAAWFPTFSLTGSIGYESASAASWVSAPSQFWALGPAATLPIFEGGAISALNDEARASYEEAVAAYRQTVLSAYQDVEDNLVALRRLAEERKSQDAATAAATRALTQANNLYKAGATNYLSVVVAQNAELQAQLAKSNLVTRQMVASVQLVKAMGGGWDKTSLADEDASRRPR